MTKFLNILQLFDSELVPRRVLNADERKILDIELNEVIGCIKERTTFELAEPLLCKLAEIQHVLARLAFKHRIELTPKQREIVRQYDRSDVENVRRNAFRLINAGEFPWQMN